MELTPSEARTLGSLLEKQALTPDYYPMTLKGLAAACNQKTSREPVMDMSEVDVLKAVRGLMAKGLAHERDTAEGRVLKYSHNLAKLGGFSSQEQAVFTVLLLRGAQTSGELRGRTERMTQFEGPAQVESALMALADRTDGPLVTRLARRPGEKEPRWTHLLCGEPAEASLAQPAVEAGAPNELATKVDALQDELTGLKVEFEELKDQVRRLLGAVPPPSGFA